MTLSSTFQTLLIFAMQISSILLSIREKTCESPNEECAGEGKFDYEEMECPRREAVRLKPLEDGDYWVDRPKIFFLESSGRDHLTPR